MQLEFQHRVPRADLALGIVVVSGVKSAATPAALSSALDACIERVQGYGAALPAQLESRRAACRERLRNGSYKPTGRGKPASEYLLKAAQEQTFPRINACVDANNLVSLQALVPISVWDLDLAQASAYEFRLGRSDERYVFNPAGQVLELKDLICGCAIRSPAADSRGTATETSQAVVNPIKDSMATKTTQLSSRLAACIYFPLQNSESERELEALTQELAHWLTFEQPSASAAHGVLLPAGRFVAELRGAPEA